MSRAAWILGPTTVAAVLAAIYPGPEELAELLTRAGAFDEATRLLERAHAAQPSDPRRFAQLLELYRKTDHQGQALELLAEASRIRRLVPQERALVRRLALGLGRPARALELLSDVPDAAAPELQAMVQLALMTRDVGAAIRLQRRLLAQHPDAAASETLVALLLQANRPGQALQAFQRGPSQLPRDRWLLRASRLAELTNDLTLAIRYQRQLLSLARVPLARDRLVALLLRAGKPKDALEVYLRRPGGHTSDWHRRAAQLAEWSRAPALAIPHLEALVHQDRDLALRMRLVRAYLDAGRPEAGLALVRRELEHRPSDASLHRSAVQLALGQRHLDLALSELQRWVARRPSDREALHQQAQILVWEGKMDEAWPTYAQLLSDPMAGSSAWREEWLGFTDLVHARTPAALENLRALSRLEPGRLDLRRQLVTALRTAKQGPEALAEARRIVLAPGAKADDRLQLARMLLWYGRTDEGLQRLRELDEHEGLATGPLREAADQAIAGHRWPQALHFLGRLIASHPTDPDLWGALARVHEQRKDLPSAIRALGHAVALAPDAMPRRLQLADLLARVERPAEALEVLKPGPQLPPAGWRARASLANELGRSSLEEAAWRQILRLTPDDVRALARLAELLDARGAQAEADSCLDQALRLTPDDPGLLLQATSRMFYGHRPQQLAGLMRRLAAGHPREPGALRLIADYYQVRDPERAVLALDTLHARGLGDARTQFQRGELAMAMHDMAAATRAWQRTLQLTEREGQAEGDELHAQALERLGRTAEAMASWQRQTWRQPRRLGPILALARLLLMDPSQAEPLVERAQKLAPSDPAVRLLRAEWLRTRGHHEAALRLFQQLQVEQPDSPYLRASVARLQQTLGHARTAALELHDALAEAPSDVLLQAYREVRDEGMARLETRSWLEQAGGWQRGSLGLRAAFPGPDGWQLSTELALRRWSGMPFGREAALGASWRSGSWSATGRLGAQALGSSVRPLANLGLGWTQGAWSTSATLLDRAWETSEKTVTQGHERRAEAQVSWQIDPRWSLRGLGAVTGLELGDRSSVGSEFLAEARLRPDPTGPWSVSYQFQHQDWGALGVAAGGVAGTEVHRLALGFATTLGPWQLELQPGCSLETRQRLVSPELRGQLELEAGNDRHVGLEAAYAGQAPDLPGSGGYGYLGLNGRWYF